MSSFLELCQEVARESGTMTGGASSIGSVVSQTGRSANIVKWTNNAWRAIQTHRPTWEWMNAQFEKSLVIGQQSYTGTELAIDRLSRFIADNKMRRISLYDPTIGYADEGYLSFVNYQDFYPVYQVGGNRSQSGKPSVVSLDSAGKIVVWPSPDKAYTLRGWYRKTPQVLAANTDVPECPEEFHEVVLWRALMFLGTYDEAVTQFPFWNVEYRRVLNKLEQNQLPQIQMPGALA